MIKVYDFEAMGDVSIEAFGNYGLEVGQKFITDQNLKRGDIIRGEFMMAWIDGTHVVEGKPEKKFVYLLNEQHLLDEACLMYRDRLFNIDEANGGMDGWLDLYGSRPKDHDNRDCYIRIL